MSSRTSWILKMEALGSSEMLITTHRSARCRIKEDLTYPHHRCENLKLAYDNPVRPLPLFLTIPVSRFYATLLSSPLYPIQTLIS
jgi:hypothetical protein